MSEAIGEALSKTPHRVLVVEDEVDIREALGVLASIEGNVRLETAADGEIALEMYHAARHNNDPYRLIVLDMSLGRGLTGMDVIGAIRAGGDDKTRLVILSAYVNEAMAFLAGVHHVLETWKKPYGVTDLMEDILRVVDFPEEVAANGGERRKNMVDMQRKMRQIQSMFKTFILFSIIAIMMLFFLLWRQNNIIDRLDAVAAESTASTKAIKDDRKK